MVQLVLMGMWQETGASREKKSELKATQVKLCTQKKKDASSSDSFRKPLLNTSVHVHAQCSFPPFSPLKKKK